MYRKLVRVLETELRQSLLPLVYGRIFHVTRSVNLQSILAEGCVRTNRDGRLQSTFGSSDISYFRQRDCVCLFDLFHSTPLEQEQHLSRCWPFAPARPGCGIAILLLAQHAHGTVITYESAKRDGALKEMIVPHVEAGYPGDMPLEAIEELIEVEVEAVPGSPLRMLREAHGQ